MMAGVALLHAERARQLEKWGDQEHTPPEWLVILVEEVGEIARAIFEAEDIDRLREEVSQAGAVCLAWLEDLERV